VTRSEAREKLFALLNLVGPLLRDLRRQVFDPDIVIDLFARYAAIRDIIRADPTFAEIPVRERPDVAESDRFGNRGHVERRHLDLLADDIRYCARVLKENGDRELRAPLRVGREGAFLGGSQFDALLLVHDLVSGAARSIALIDAYVGTQTLQLLAAKQREVSASVLTRAVDSPTLALARAFGQQHGALEIRTSTAFHDRFLIVDDTDVYHFGASIKDLGKRGFMFSRVEEPLVVTTIRNAWASAWASASPVSL
jgi:hypothetical protein